MAILLGCLTLVPLFADTEGSALPLAPKAKDGTPEIAYHLFSNWANNYQEKAKRAKAWTEGILFAGGGLALGGAALTWYGGDSISESNTGSPMDYSDRRNWTIGLGITGGAMIAGGVIAATVPIKDYRAIYADVYEEEDPEVREAMAVSVLRYQADRGKERRVSSIIWSFAIPLVSGVVAAAANVSDNEPWSKDVLKTMAGASWGSIGGVVSIFSRSPEERLYQRYLDARDAYYGEKR